MAPLPGRATTPSTSLTEESSTSTTTPTTLMDMSPKSLTMALLPSPLLLLVLDMASLTVVLSDMALPMEELPTSAKPFVNDFQDTRDTTQDDRQRRHTDKILDNIFPIFIYLLINMNTSRK